MLPRPSLAYKERRNRLTERTRAKTSDLVFRAGDCYNTIILGSQATRRENLHMRPHKISVIAADAYLAFDFISGEVSHSRHRCKRNGVGHCGRKLLELSRRWDPFP